MKRVHYSEHMPRKQDCRHIERQSFSENNFADFSDVVRVKKIKISSSCWWRFLLPTHQYTILKRKAPTLLKLGAFCHNLQKIHLIYVI